MKHHFLLLYTWFVRSILFFLPEIKPIMRFRGWLYSLGMKSCGKNFRVTSDVTIRGLNNISIGENVFIGNNSMILSRGDIIIESNVLIGPHNIIVASSHTFLINSYYGKPKAGNIRICEGSWICANCTVTNGAYLPPRSILAPNSTLGKLEFIETDSLYSGESRAKLKKKLR